MPINLNRATTGNDIHMNCSTPICPGELRIRVAKGNMQARHLLILQQITNQPFQTRQRTDSELTGTIAIRRREKIIVDILRDRGIRDLIGLFDRVGHDRPRGLLAVPRALASQATRQFLQFD